VNALASNIAVSIPAKSMIALWSFTSTPNQVEVTKSLHLPNFISSLEEALS
jgi:hypothetical protein